jgi:hypothetical protein
MLTGPEQLTWTNALFGAFSETEFAQLLLHRLDDRAGNYAAGSMSFRTVISEVVDAYSRRDLEEQLVAAALGARPRNAALLGLASLKNAAAAPDRTNLERLIKATSSFLNFSAWLDAAAKVQVCVCRIEIAAEGGGTIFGTGFLIGADLVMTNWHVVECIAAVEDRDVSYQGPRARSSSLLCRFDYKVLASGARNMGSTFQLANAWRVALSPNSQDDREPNPNQLDCAVLRLAKSVGTLTIGEKLSGDPRGWISLSNAQASPAFKPHSPLFIVQHPEGEPLKLALDTDSIQSVNANRTRVRYSTNTEAGSSGSPCFDENWNLVALHHSGDPNFAPNHKPEFNEGIPMDAIVRYLQGQGLALT